MVNPTTAMPEAPMSGLANLMAMKGRDNDSMLVHLSPNEVNNLNKLSGNTMTINPATGLPEGRSRFLEAALPALLSIGVGIATGGASIPAQMAAQAAAGYGGAKLMGKEDDEALTSGLVSGATAGLFGGLGSSGGAEAALNPAVPATLGQQTGNQVIGQGMKGGTEAVKASVNPNLLANLNNKIAGGDLSAIAKTLGSDSRSFNTLAADAFAKGNYTDPAFLVAGAGQIGQKTGMNAVINQMRDDANRPIPEQEDMSNPIDIYSTPFTQTSMGPFNQQQIASNFISGGSGPYGMNFLNQAYGQEGGQVEEMEMLKEPNNPGLKKLPPQVRNKMGYAKEGGQVEEMNQGGLTQFNSIMGNPALQLQNPNPPMQMAFGGSASAQMSPRGSSQGGKGSGAFSEMLNNPEVLAMLQGSGAPQDTKSYDVLASIGANPVQAMNQGGMTNAGTANSSVIPAIVPLIQAANEQAQARFARGGAIVDGLKAIAGNRAFEGRVKGPGDGMSDDIPFNIEGQQPALLARDEYVIPADVVSMIGNGSSDAGSEQIDAAIANIRQDKYGRAQQPRETEGLGGLLG
tara:strand:- start:2480 stop:4198 length:1719 start_codon:yes stop_codon:yes gene_type:complete